MTSYIKALNTRNNPYLDLQRSSSVSTKPAAVENLTFLCKSHINKPIIFICTAKSCENNLLCPECVLESPSILIKYKDNMCTLQDYVTSSKNRLLHVKVEKELQTLKKKVTDIFETIKNSIKEALSESSSPLFSRDDHSIDIDRKLVKAASSNKSEKEDIFNKENLKTFIKEANKYEEFEKGYYENPYLKQREDAIETRYFEFLAKIKLQIDGFCKTLQNHAAVFIEKSRDIGSYTSKTEPNEAKPYTKITEILTADKNQSKKAQGPSERPSYSDFYKLNFSSNEEDTFNFEQEMSKPADDTTPNNTQLKGLATNFSKDPGDEIEPPFVNGKLSLPLPRPGLKVLKEFPPVSNPAIKETLVKNGPFIADNYGVAQNYIDKNSPSNQNSSSQAKMKYGPILMENEDIYEGEWVEDRREGYGKLVSTAGFLFDGYWKDNLAHGRGRLININGDMYEGDWLNGKYHGKGTFIGLNGYQYTGDWSHDMQHGFGSEYWPDGSSYEGEYKWSKKHGKGTFKWANGEKYIGEFCLNNMHGNGIYEWPNGQKYYGYWCDNKISGEGRLESAKSAKKMGDWEKKVLLSPDCALFKREMRERFDEGEEEEDLTVDPRIRRANIAYDN